MFCIRLLGYGVPQNSRFKSVKHQVTVFSSQLGRLQVDSPPRTPDAPVMFDKMLRLLLSYDVLKCCVKRGDNGQVERVYAAAPVCKFLVQNPDGGSVGPLLLLHHDKVLMESWYHFNDAILEGGIPFNRAFGMKAFDYYGSDERLGRIFNQAMSSHATFIMKKLIDVYKGFEGLKAVVDVGGGIGTSLDIITSKYPHIKGINFDLPHVIDDAPSYPGVEHVDGDMFQCVLKGGDAIFMKGFVRGDTRVLLPGQ